MLVVHRATAALLLLATAEIAGGAVFSQHGGSRPQLATSPRVLGVPEVGAVLRARSGTWKGARPIRIAYRWQRCTSGATTRCVRAGASPRYVPGQADLGSRMRVVVRVTNRAGTGSAASRLTAAVEPPPVVDAAGDIACDPSSAQFGGGQGTRSNCLELATSNLLVADKPRFVLPLGDDQYECGRADAFAQSYDPSWGRLKAVTRPAIGNHEYGRGCGLDDPAPYFDYFGAAAGKRYQGWYSYAAGTWHMIALNSECGYGKKSVLVGGCGPGSPEERWLRSDLARHPSACTLAYWHEPRFSSGEHGDAQQMATIWNDLVAAHADVVLSGHNHDYERFDPIGATPAGTEKFQNPVLDPNGIREFVVGTGGRNVYPFSAPPLTGQVVRDARTFGVLHLTLRAGAYDWRFEPAGSGTFTDAGSGACH